MRLLEYLDENGRSPFAQWYGKLNAPAAAKIYVGLERTADGNLSNAESVGQGVTEHRIDFGPGYRIYFARDGDSIVILLGGGTKKRQQNDIARAHARWNEYRQRRKRE